MRLFILGLTLILTLGETVQAQIEPYEAVVHVEKVEVRSGSSDDHYPTSQLKRNDLVTVCRHDLGGWYMIVPPKGDFSWIEAKQVKRTGDLGTVTSNNVYVYVGSSVDDVRDQYARLLATGRTVYQIKLSTGDTVQILGEQTFETDRGSLKMYKIKPPKREYRWIPGSAVIAREKLPKQQPAADPFGTLETGLQADNALSQEQTSSPFEKKTGALQAAGSPEPSVPAVQRQNGSSRLFEPVEAITRSPSPQNNAGISGQTSTGGSPRGISQRGGRGSLSGQRDSRRSSERELSRKLAELDERLSALEDQDPGQWDLDGLEQAYRQLRQGASRSWTYRIDGRLTVLDQYKPIKAEHDDFLRLTSAVRQREAQLRALQEKQQQRLQQLQMGAVATPASPPATPQASQGLAANPQGTFIPPAPEPASGGSQWQEPNDLERIARGTLPPTPTDPSASMNSERPRFDGAGIIDRIAANQPGAPSYVLLAPDGRVLAYLQGEPGVNLEPYRGQAMGILGRRWYRSDLQTDFILVREMTPVRLARQ